MVSLFFLRSLSVSRSRSACSPIEAFGGCRDGFGGRGPTPGALRRRKKKKKRDKEKELSLSRALALAEPKKTPTPQNQNFLNKTNSKFVSSPAFSPLPKTLMHATLRHPRFYCFSLALSLFSVCPVASAFVFIFAAPAFKFSTLKKKPQNSVTQLAFYFLLCMSDDENQQKKCLDCPTKWRRE